MKTLIEADADDESLRKYKEALLGNVGNTYAPADDPRRVVITELRIVFQDRPDGDIVYPLDSQASLDELKKKPFSLKEGCNYKIQVSFRVQHEIVSGLAFHNSVYKGPLRVDRSKEMLGSFGPKEGCNYKIQVSFRVQHEIVSGLAFHNSVYKGPLRVDRSKEMLGSFGPKEESYTVITPRRGWEETPSGAMARGNYKAKSFFEDDDKVKHLAYEYAFKIAKDY
eukprot:TRINITY_DN6418_c0_g1_i5.p2 TRINITY_DN6418_c0_g1~~TRINITY_DN6418_c0_g1_i5.p2  ORF type:complete len:224 (-),score=-35.82 TRINITY_DN6418_c0_g1_i5:27-698(-)